MRSVSVSFLAPVAVAASCSSSRHARRGTPASPNPISKPVVKASAVFASPSRRTSLAANETTGTKSRGRDVRVFAENDGRGPNPNDVDGPVKFGGEMVGVGIFLLIAFQFFVLAFVDFPFQAR
jgi:hypothetical protein